MLGTVALVGKDPVTVIDLEFHDVGPSNAQFWAGHAADEIELARLTQNRLVERYLCLGAAVFESANYLFPEDSLADQVTAELIAAISERHPFHRMVHGRLPGPPPGTSEADLVNVRNLLLKVLTHSSSVIAHVSVMQLLLTLSIAQPVPSRVLAKAVLAHPELRAEIPELQDFGVYGGYAELIRKAEQMNLGVDGALEAIRNPSDATVSAIIHLLGGDSQVG